MILATLVMTLASVWCAMASSYNSLIAARIFQAIGGAAADTVAPALLGDIYFVDERGRALVSQRELEPFLLLASAYQLTWSLL